MKRARIEHARETRSFVPDWYGKRVLALGEQHAARIALSGPSAPGLLVRPRPGPRRARPAADAQGGHQGRQRPHDELDDRAVPEAGLGRLVFPDLPPDEASRGWSSELLHVLRLDEEDPIAVWRARADALVTRRAADRAALRRAALRGPGHRPDSACCAHRAGGRPVRDRRRHRAHAEPPDRGGVHHARPERADGHVTSTKPLVLIDGTVVRGLRRALRGRPGGRTSRRPGQRDVAAIAGRDEGAARLGEGRWSTARAASASSGRSQRADAGPRGRPAQPPQPRGTPRGLPVSSDRGQRLAALANSRRSTARGLEAHDEVRTDGAVHQHERLGGGHRAVRALGIGRGEHLLRQEGQLCSMPSPRSGTGPRASPTRAAGQWSGRCPGLRSGARRSAAGTAARRR